MKLTLVKPNIGRMEHSLYVDEGRMEPLQLGVLAALTPPDVEVIMHDDRCEDIPYHEETDLVAITVETYTARRAYEIAAKYRQRGIPVIMGGMQPTLIPEEVQEHADSIYIGDAEFRWAEMIADAKKGKLKPVYNAKVGVPQPGVMTRRDIFKGKGYLPIKLMQFTRGCRFACTFCAVSSFFSRKHYTRNIPELVREIQESERKLIFFVDDNIVSDQTAAKELFRALIPLKVHWVSQASIDMTRDQELMELMAASGCVGNVIGFESLSPDSLKWMKKGPNVTRQFDRYSEQLEVLRKHGLQTWAAFTLGHDHDTLDSIMATGQFAHQNKFTFAAFNILVQYPGTPLYDRMKKEGRLLYNDKWWLHPEYRFNHATFRPQNMSPEELTEACFQLRSDYNRVGAIVRRAFDFKTNMRSLYKMAVYLRYTPLYRKETFKKQGMRFGLH
ncbi:MAG: radical SAM protein [Calditrichota bacterium]